MGRPALTKDELRARVLAYCTRYGVSPGAEGLPPFPTGKRETRQHREWLTVYRAHRRSQLRMAAEEGRAERLSSSDCPLCHRPLAPDPGAPYAPPAARTRPQREALLHPACADLARRAEALGPEVVARLPAFLWPGRPRRRG